MLNANIEKKVICGGEIFNVVVCDDAGVRIDVFGMNDKFSAECHLSAIREEIKSGVYRQRRAA